MSFDALVASLPRFRIDGRTHPLRVGGMRVTEHFAITDRYNDGEIADPPAWRLTHIASGFFAAEAKDGEQLAWIAAHLDAAPFSAAWDLDWPPDHPLWPEICQERDRLVAFGGE